MFSVCYQSWRFSVLFAIWSKIHPHVLVAYTASVQTHGGTRDDVCQANYMSRALVVASAFVIGMPLQSAICYRHHKHSCGMTLWRSGLVCAPSASRKHRKLYVLLLCTNKLKVTIQRRRAQGKQAKANYLVAKNELISSQFLHRFCGTVFRRCFISAFIGPEEGSGATAAGRDTEEGRSRIASALEDTPANGLAVLEGGVPAFGAAFKSVISASMALAINSIVASQ